MMSMEQFMKQCDRESMKMAMLKHEETFRQQVRELHRLYRIQKQLMKDLKNKKALNLQLPAEEYIGRTEHDVMPETEEEEEEERELELTLAIGSNRKKREEAPLASDSGASFSSSSTESGNPGGQESIGGFACQKMRSPWLQNCLSLKMT